MGGNQRTPAAQAPFSTCIGTAAGGIEYRMTHATLSPRQYMILLMVAVCAPLGDTCLSRGMNHLPPIAVAHPAVLAGALVSAVFTPWIAFGIALLIVFFASYLTALSWADLTYVLPATAFGNVIVALLSRYWLHETISFERWSGIILITLGVGFVAQGPSTTTRPASVAFPDLAPAAIPAPALEEEQL
jgi:drug/metabolite transporter (DMT)-like permease